VKIAIAGGAGGVGSSLAFNLLLAQESDEIVLIDPNESLVESHVMDLEQLIELEPGSTVRGGDLDDASDADVLVISAAVPLTLAKSRGAYLVDNGRIVEVIASAVPLGWSGVAIMVTNPVDPLVVRFRERTGMERRRVLGYTLNDSLRLRTGISERLGVAAGSVLAWSIGEHGDGHVPVFSQVAVGGEPAILTTRDEQGAEAFLDGWFRRHVALDAGRTSTWTSGRGVSRMIAALRNGGGERWPASLVLDGEYGIHGVAVSVPVRLGSGGAEEIEEWKLEPREQARLEEAAGLVRSAVETLEGALVGERR
jgi:malate dehydrogenase